MFSTPISLILVYCLSVANFLLLFIPELILGVMLYYISGYKIDIMEFKNFFIFLIFIISFFTLLYMFIDFLFAIYIKAFAKLCTPYKDKEMYLIFDTPFNTIKKKYKQKKVELLILEDAVVNAFALASFRKKYIILSLGLVNEFLKKTNGDQEKFLQAIEGVIGHEMSHLVNKDFLPGLMLEINKKIIFKMQSIVSRFLAGLAILLAKVPVIGIFFSLFVNMFFVLNNLSIKFYNLVVLKIYYLFKSAISRAIEYRSDKQSSKACGGETMAYSLSLLPGGKGYSTIFSTHPKTEKRIKKASKIKSGRIHISIIGKLSNIIAIVGMVYICYYCGKAIDIFGLLNTYYIFFNNIIYKLKDVIIEILQTLGVNI